MSFFIKQLVSQRIKRITPNEIIKYANEYNLSIQREEAEQIQYVLQTTDFDPLSLSDHQRLFQKLQHITNEETANKTERILHQLLQENGFDQYLY